MRPHGHTGQRLSGMDGPDAPSVWMTSDRVVRTQAPWPRHADVVVVGAGLTGLSAALTLRQAGREVLVLEAGRVGGQASGRNGGQVLTGVNPSWSRLTRDWGAEWARTLYVEGARAAAYVDDLVRRLPIACDWHQGGHVALIPDPGRERALRQEVALLRENGHPVSLLTRDAVRAALGFGDWPLALHDPRSGTVNPYRLTVGLATAAVNAGAVVLEEHPAGVRIENGRLRVETPSGSLIADQVLAAVNAWLPDTVPSWARRARRVHATVIATPPLGSLADGLLPNRPAVFEESPRIIYLQLTGDGRLVFGARADGPDPVAALTDTLHQTIPGLTGVEAATAWRGALAITRDGLPRLGVEPPGLYWVGGYSGHGVALATYLGHRMGLWMAGGPHPRWIPGAAPRWLPDRVASRTRFRPPAPTTFAAARPRQPSRPQ